MAFLREYMAAATPGSFICRIEWRTDCKISFDSMDGTSRIRSCRRAGTVYGSRRSYASLSLDSFLFQSDQLW